MSNLKNINKKYGLCINAKKTEVMITDRLGNSISNVNNLDGVRNKYYYLGDRK